MHDTPEALARALAPRVAKGEWDVVGQLAVQIKDAATDRGAERVLLALLNDGRRTSSEARTHLVAFAARCLDVAEVPPALVREITDRAFDQLTEDANHALTYLPLWRDRVGETIADVLAERVAELMASDDPTLAARFATHATFCAARNATSAYWHRLERRLTAEHRDALAELARIDDAIWMRLIDRGVLTLAAALRLRGPRGAARPAVAGGDARRARVAGDRRPDRVVLRRARGGLRGVPRRARPAGPGRRAGGGGPGAGRPPGRVLGAAGGASTGC